MGADLSDAKIFKADFLRANLMGANLKNANLSGADLMEANLSGADFTGTVLSGANLTGANLRFSINLSLAEIESAIFNRKTQFPDYIPISWTSESTYKLTGTALQMVKS